MRTSNILWMIFYTGVVVGVICLELELGKRPNGEPGFEQLDLSCGKRNLPLVLHNYSVRIEGTKIWGNCTFTAREDINSDSKIWLQIEKCKNAENLDTCEQIYNIHLEKVCSILNPNYPGLGYMVTYVKPEFRCPVKKNFYRIENLVADVALFVMIPQERQYWRGRFEVRHNETNRLFFCFKAATHVGSKW